MSWAEAIRDGRWADFAGLPNDLDVAMLLTALGRSPRRSERPDLLGRQERTLAELEGLRCWLDGPRVILVELEDPPSVMPASELLVRLGVADRERPGRPRFGATVTDHVYVRRGLAITIAESYDDPPKVEPFLAAVRLFAPIALETYLSELGGLDRTQPHFQ